MRKEEIKMQISHEYCDDVRFTPEYAVVAAYSGSDFYVEITRVDGWKCECTIDSVEIDDGEAFVIVTQNDDEELKPYRIGLHEIKRLHHL